MLEKIDNIKIENYDHVIIGTGPAGITLALKLKKNIKKKILLIEAGNFDYDEKSQEYYKGEVLNNCNLKKLHHSRIRAFGGTSMVWGGMCKELDEVDFNEWPIEKNDLINYKDEARKILLIDRKYLKDKFISKNIKLVDFQWSEPTARFNEFYKDEILNDKKIDLLIETAAIRVEGKKNLDILELYDHKHNRYHKIKPTNVILACGAIENSRILLYSQAKSKFSFLNDLKIGKNYLIHPHYIVGRSLVEMKKIKEILDKNYMNKEMFFLAPTKDFILKNKIGNICIRIQINKYPHKTKEIIKDLLCVAPEYAKRIASLGKKKIDCANIKFFSSWEVLPNNNNYIELDENNLDDLGIPRVKIFANLEENVKITLKTFIEEIGKFFIDKEIGRVSVRNFFYSGDYIWPEDGYGGSHEMGGTKMGDTNKDSVVDKDLKVHGINNLYVLGSSIFPTAGHANPTFTICQLALRLGDHLKNKIS